MTLAVHRPNEDESALEGAKLRAFLRNVYRDAPSLLRVLSIWRSSISPFAPLLRDVPRHARVLDFGCGTGALLLSLAARDGEVRGVGCDTSEPAIIAAQKAAATLQSCQVEFRRIAGLRDLPADSFEAVFLVDVLHHIPVAYQHDAFKAAAARVAPGGLLIYKDIARYPLWMRLANTFHDLLLSRQLVSYVPMREVVEWGEAVGLTAVRRQDYRRVVYAHELCVFRRG